MNIKNLISNIINLIKAIKNIITGKSFSSVRSYYDYRHLTKFIKPNLPKIDIHCIMCGYPRSGTHWIRNVVEKSTGERTYDMSKNKPVPSDTNVCLIKIHARSKFVARLKALWLPRHNFQGKYIYVYRDPRDAIISLYEMYKKKKNLPDLKQEDFLKIYDHIGQYKWEINAWVLKNHKNVMLVKFEDLKAQPEVMFERILAYLNLVGTLDKSSIDEKVGLSDSKNRHRATSYAWKHAGGSYRCIVDSVNRELKKEIKLLGYKEG